MSTRKESTQPPHFYKLSAEEISDPSLVVSELFDFARLPQVRGMLWDWLKSTVTGSYPKSLSGKERTDIILLYEKMEKLVEAAHILEERKRKKGNRRIEYF